jgi:thymidylate synthase ThyX
LKVVGAKDVEEAFAKWSAVLGTGDKETVEEMCVIPVKDFWRSCAASVLEYLTCRINGIEMENCRYALPQAVRTSLLMTLNARELLHIIKLRADRRAQWEIRGIALALRDLSERVVPELYEEGVERQR